MGESTAGPGEQDAPAAATGPVTAAGAPPAPPTPTAAPRAPGPRWRMPVLVAALLLLGAGLALGIYFLGQALGAWGSTSVTMPNVIGKTATAARTSLQSRGVAVGASDLIESNVPVGHVAATDPAAGEPVQNGQRATLFVSAGPPDVTVPRVVGHPVAQAEHELARHHLHSKTHQTPSKKAVGTVVDQTPPPGVKVARKTTVTLDVSSGPARVTVPNVAGQPAAKAGGTLGSAGLKVGNTVSEASTTVPAGSVVGTNPPAGTSVAKGSVVEVIVSTGAGGGSATTTPTQTTPTSPTVPTTPVPTSPVRPATGVNPATGAAGITTTVPRGNGAVIGPSIGGDSPPASPSGRAGRGTTLSVVTAP